MQESSEAKLRKRPTTILPSFLMCKWQAVPSAKDESMKLDEESRPVNKSGHVWCLLTVCSTHFHIGDSGQPATTDTGHTVTVNLNSTPRHTPTGSMETLHARNRTFPSSPAFS